MKLQHTLAALTALSFGCATAPTAEDESPSASASVSGGATHDAAAPEKRLDATADHRWIYAGLLPALDDWRAVLSLAGHTVRLTGTLPKDWSTPLPFWASPAHRPDGRVDVTVVYPISTARLTDAAGTPTGARNATPGDYPFVSAYPFTPSDPVRGTPWGGFPYLEYDLQRNLAFHGPITAENGSWRVLGGPVSHGCARMQGEHVVELAQLMGLDMGDPDAPARGFPASTGDFRVQVLADFDRLADGRVVDVDYPGVDGFVRPAGGPESVAVFPTWSTDDFPRFVCAFDPERPLGDEHCDALTETGRNPLRPGDLGAIACPAGYAPLTVGTDGGVLCTDGTNAWGPFTRGMIVQCKAWGGGRTCETDRWALTVARRARGTGVCPTGARLDARDTAYCVEGNDAFGPFPPEYVAECERRGGGRACRSSRWSLSLLRGTIARLGRRTADGVITPGSAR